MWSFLLSLIPGAFSTINGITNAISNTKIAALNAKTDQERIAAEEQVKTLEVRRDVLVAESASPWNGLMRFMLALGPMVILNKLLIWDKVIGSFNHCSGKLGELNAVSCSTFRTDIIDSNTWWVITAVVGFYFLAESIRRFK